VDTRYLSQAARLAGASTVYTSSCNFETALPAVLNKLGILHLFLRSSHHQSPDPQFVRITADQGKSKHDVTDDTHLVMLVRDPNLSATVGQKSPSAAPRVPRLSLRRLGPRAPSRLHSTHDLRPPCLGARIFSGLLDASAGKALWLIVGESKRMYETFVICCDFPFSRTSKSFASRFLTWCPLESVTTAST
jgi:hypothetical protein